MRLPGILPLLHTVPFPESQETKNISTTSKYRFSETVMVPDGPRSSAFPPSLGTFPLYQVKDYVDELRNEMALKGRLSLPMYRTSNISMFF
jgi:hypothetical protein